MGITQVRELLRPQNPFVIGANYDRPAPVHVANGFVASALGVSTLGIDLRRFLVPKKPGDPPPPSLQFASRAPWAEESNVLTSMRQDLLTIFNPDRRMWTNFGSPVPVVSLLANSDPSDDGYGPLVWELVRRHATEDYLHRLQQMLQPASATDPVTLCATILTDGAQAGSKRGGFADETSWFGTEGSVAGKLLAKNLTQFVEQLTQPREDARRLAGIQHLTRGLYFVTVIALLLGPLAAKRTQPTDTVDQIGMMVMFADTPPGPARDPMVTASLRSFQLLLASNRIALAEKLAATLANHTLPSRLPPRQRRREALRVQLASRESATPSKIEEILQRLDEDTDGMLAGDNPGDVGWCTQLIDSAYSPALVTSAVRSMARKVGLVGPDRGGGSPRFLCETPLLGTLVAGLGASQSRDFEEFVDLARERLGIVFGPGTREDLAEQLNLWEGAGIGRQLLRDNQDALRQRLIRAGLAREYSDGYTEVVYNA